MSLGRYFQYLDENDKAKRLAFEESEAKSGSARWIVAAVPLAYFAVYLIERFA